MKKVIQPYESHMQYLAQWMCDYNLYGCAYLDSTHVKFRCPVPEHLSLSNTGHKWHDQSVPEHLMSDETKVARQSHCSIEVDIMVEHITNRHEIRPRSIHHDFAERSMVDKSGEKLVHSMAGLWRDETRRRKARMGLLDPNSSPFPPEVLVSVSADPRNSQPGGWIHEEEFRELIQGLVKDEEGNKDPRRSNFDTFVKRHPQ